MAVGLFVGVYVARYLGPERFGVLSYAMSVVVLFSALSSLGLNGILVRELVNFPKKRDEFLGTAFILKLAGSGLVLILLSITLYFMGDDRQSNLMIFIIAAGLIFQPFNVIRFYFEANVLAKFIAVSQITSLVVVSVAKLVFIWLGLPLIYFASAVLIESLVLAIGLSVVYFKQKLNIFNWQFSFKAATGLLKDSWPLILSAIAISIYMRIDQVMIKHMLNDEAVGQYAAAVRLSEAWYFIPMIITASLFPAILNAKKVSQELYYKRLQKLYDLMVWVAIAIALPMTLLSGWIVNLLYGEQYNQAGSVLMIHIWAGVFVFMGVASGKWYLAENFNRLNLRKTVSGGIVNILLNTILIPKYGIIGAACATIFSQGTASYLLDFVFKKTRTNFFRLSRTFNIFRVIH
jgi:O-antigen/teichoic acid export membrane protein